VLRDKPCFPHLKNPDSSWAINDSKKGELFQNHLTEVFKPHTNIENQLISNDVTNYFLSPLQMSLPPKAFSPAKVKHCISTFLKKKKSPGFDLITYEVERHLPRKTLVLLTYILNAIFYLSHFPLQSKFSIIVVIPKPGKPPDSSTSYRPISLFPFFSKVLEKLILKRLTLIIFNSRIIPNTQFGFRNFHSTIHQINCITDTITASLEIKKTILYRSLS
jgi:hypothetical protein